VTFEPYITSESGTSARAAFELEVTKCPTCGKYMMPKVSKQGYRRGSNLFPFHVDRSQEAQMKKLGVVFVGSWYAALDSYVCEECVEA
jgi:hypothetical protein